jgi:hypothetical protein
MFLQIQLPRVSACPICWTAASMPSRHSGRLGLSRHFVAQMRFKFVERLRRIYAGGLHFPPPLLDGFVNVKYTSSFVSKCFGHNFSVGGFLQPKDKAGGHRSRQ